MQGTADSLTFVNITGDFFDVMRSNTPSTRGQLAGDVAFAGVARVPMAGPPIAIAGGFLWGNREEITRLYAHQMEINGGHDPENPYDIINPGR